MGSGRCSLGGRCFLGSRWFLLPQAAQAPPKRWLLQAAGISQWHEAPLVDALVTPDYNSDAWFLPTRPNQGSEAPSRSKLAHRIRVFPVAMALLAPFAPRTTADRTAAHRKSDRRRFCFDIIAGDD